MISTSLLSLIMLFLRIFKFKSQMDPEIFKVKIRSGIVRLRRVNETVLADYYETELNKLKKRHFASKILKVIILIFVSIFAFLGLIYFAI